MKNYLLTILLIPASFLGHAQIYQTKAGVIIFSGIYKSHAVVAESSALHMNLNYDRAEIAMHVAIPLLVSNNDTLTKLLTQMAGSELSFHGTMNTNHIHIKPHQKIQHSISGTVTLNEVSKPFRFNSTIEHFPSGNVSCIISGNFSLNLLDFGIPALRGEERVAIRFRELLLKKVNE